MASIAKAFGRRNAFLAIWAAAFLTGLAALAPANVLYILAVTFGDSVVVFALFYVLYSLLRGSLPSKALGLFLALLVCGFAVANLAAVNGQTVAQLFTWGQVLGRSPPGGTTTSTETVMTPTFNTTIFNQGGSQNPIDATWVQGFLTAVNRARQANGIGPLTERVSLDQFASLRFSTLSKNYQISHYGLDHDVSCFFLNCIPGSEINNHYYFLNQTVLGRVLGHGASLQQPSNGSYWQVTLSCASCNATTVYFSTGSALNSYVAGTYGEQAKVTFNSDGSFSLTLPGGHGEEVLYPAGTSPDSYAALVETQAPYHWQDLLSASFLTYGFSIGSAPTYSITNTCPATEVVGPNINQTQYFIQQGCRFDIRAGVWLVLELGN